MIPTDRLAEIRALRRKAAGDICFFVTMRTEDVDYLLERVEALEKKKKGHAFFSSASVEWATPWTLFNELDAEFAFTLDVCATEDNAKCQRFYSPAEDGLRQEWHGTCWMNPPYGRTIGEWVAKAHESAKSDDTLVVCLLPARTDTRWWHDHVMGAEQRFLKGRVRFNDAGPAPFPSCVVIFR